MLDIKTSDKNFILKVIGAISTLNRHMELCCAIFDPLYTVMFSSPSFAHFIGYKTSNECLNKTLSVAPNLSIMRQANLFQQNIDKAMYSTTPLKYVYFIHNNNQTNNLQPVICTNERLLNKETNNTIGVLITTYNFQLNGMLNLLLEKKDKNLLGGFELMFSQTQELNLKLSEYYFEISYLITLDFTGQEIADFMNKHRPPENNKLRTKDTIEKAKRYICDQLNLSNYNGLALKKYLISLGINKYIPANFVLKA